MPCGEGEGEDAEEVEVGVAVVVVVTTRTSQAVRAVKLSPTLQKAVTRAPSIQIFLQESGKGAECIINTAGMPFSVPNLLHALGKMSTLQNHSNENLTSLAVIHHQFTTHCTMTIIECRK